MINLFKTYCSDIDVIKNVTKEEVFTTKTLRFSGENNESLLSVMKTDKFKNPENIDSDKEIITICIIKYGTLVETLTEQEYKNLETIHANSTNDYYEHQLDKKVASLSKKQKVN